MVNVQKYPRLENDLLDESKLVRHFYKIPFSVLKAIIVEAIEIAGRKSSRAILNLPDNAPQEEVTRTYSKEGKELFRYFVKYCGDAASTALQCTGRKCSDIAKQQFRNRTLQKERMNSAWRYQYIAKDAASASKRFESVSDIGLAEADFNAVIRYRNRKTKLTVYVSVKNRSNTMGGQDWPKAIVALERVASSDKNRDGEYICVFGLSVERGTRLVKRNKLGAAFSSNTELWFADFFWPFFSNYTYEEIAKLVLDVLIATEKRHSSIEDIPKELLDSFEKCCKENNLLDEQGRFVDPYKLVEFFCSSRKKVPKK
jgi:hypothetical protein